MSASHGNCKNYPSCQDNFLDTVTVSLIGVFIIHDDGNKSHQNQSNQCDTPKNADIAFCNFNQMEMLSGSSKVT